MWRPHDFPVLDFATSTWASCNFYISPPTAEPFATKTPNLAGCLLLAVDQRSNTAISNELRLFRRKSDNAAFLTEFICPWSICCTKIRVKSRKSRKIRNLAANATWKVLGFRLLWARWLTWYLLFCTVSFCRAMLERILVWPINKPRKINSFVGKAVFLVRCESTQSSSAVFLRSLVNSLFLRKRAIPGSPRRTSAYWKIAAILWQRAKQSKCPGFLAYT